MLEEAAGLAANGHDVLVADAEGEPAASRAFDLDRALKRLPDLVVLEDLARPNPPGARNRTRYQDAEELLRSGIDVFATLRVADLANERARVVALGAEVPPEPVPDYLLYGASSVEFVDIDPDELADRLRVRRREMPAGSLRDLRLLALRCVSDYAASTGGGRDHKTPEFAVPGRGRVVAILAVGEEPRAVLLEASRLALASRGDLECVCVRRGRHGARPLPAGDDAAYAELEAQVEAMGHELVTLYGDDPVEVLRGYLRTQGASDVVMQRRASSGLRRAAAPMGVSFAERVTEGLADVGLHLVGGRPYRGSLNLAGRAAAWLSDFRVRDVALTLLCMALAYLAARGALALGAAEAVSYVALFAGVAAASLLGRGYVPAVAAAVAAVLVQDYFFIRPFYSFDVDHRASALVLALFAACTLAAAVLAVRLGRARDRSDDRERRTQALFDLDRSLSSARSASEAVDVALDVTVRLFERTAAVYLVDPFAEAGADPAVERRRLTVREVVGDAGRQVFERVNEQAVAHWVFTNLEPAGAGTDTHAESYVLYLPLAGRDGAEGVLAVSCNRSLSLSERSFLDLVADQVALALERQSLLAKHRDDLRVSHVTAVRSSFVALMVSASSTAADTQHALAELARTAPEADRGYREAVLGVLGEEAARERQLTERVYGVLGEQPGPSCDVRAEVSRAVDEVREGLSGKVVGLEPGEAVPLVAADAALVRLAVKLVVEAATGYVGPGGMVQVAVRTSGDQVSVVVADDRSPERAPSRTSVFELADRQERQRVPAYAELRARRLREALADREAMADGRQGTLAAFCCAMQLPLGAARSDADPEGLLNRHRVLRYNRLEYGLYVAALVACAHGGTIKQRYRLGGGVVVTLSLPRL
jgi:two-component system sensor histidine kinase KdpD